MKRILLLMMLTVIVSVFTACNKNNGDGKTTVEEDKVNIQASFDRMKSLLQSFHDGNFYSFAEEFLGAGMHDGWDYWYVGERKGDYSWVSGYYEYTPGKGEYELIISYDYYYIGEGMGDYSYVDGEYVFTPGEGDHYRVEYQNYNWVGKGNGDYSCIEGYYEYTPGQGDYDRESHTYYDFVIPEFTRLLGEEFANIADLDDIENSNRFKMSTFAGNYTWNNVQQKWDRSSRNDILVQFPSKENSSLNCELGITKYDDQKCDIEGDEIYLPTKVSAHFNKDNVKTAGVEVEASYTGYGIPKTASVDVYAKPISLAATLMQDAASKYSATLLISDETSAQNTLSVSGEAALSKDVDNYSSFSDLEINNLKISLQQVDLSIKGSIDFKTLNNINEPSVTDINASLSLEVLWKNKKIGTLRVQEVDGDRFLFIVYSDDSRENTSMYYDSFVKDIENMFKNK